MVDDSWKIKLDWLLRTGRSREEEGDISDVEVALAIQLIKYAATEHPDELLQRIGINASFEMMPLALAILMGKAEDAYIRSNKGLIKHMMSGLDPTQLLEMVEYLKSKTFGRGLGRRPQKMVKDIMESWGIALMDDYILKHPQSFKILIKLIHPRYKGPRGELIQILLYN